jgi:hypothetical protein
MSIVSDKAPDFGILQHFLGFWAATPDPVVGGTRSGDYPRLGKKSATSLAAESAESEP